MSQTTSDRRGLTRRTVIQGATAAPAALAFPGLVRAQAGPVRVGYAMARTGPWTTGAQVSQEPNYLLWAEQQNAAGGLNVKGTKRPIELISSDDRSDIETCVRTYEKLMGSDKVDLILPPWGSNANFAVAPLTFSMSTSASIIGLGCCSIRKKYGSFISMRRRLNAVGARKG